MLRGVIAILFVSLGKNGGEIAGAQLIGLDITEERHIDAGLGIEPSLLPTGNRIQHPFDRGL